MKPLIITLVIIHVFISFLSGQVSPIKNSLQTDISKVISDYPNGFKNISGEQVINNPQSSEFDCRLSIKDASKCRVIKYSAAVKDIYSWEAEMLKTDDYDMAVQKFRSVYNSLQHLSVDINGTKATFKGEYIKPSESIKFTTVIFTTGDKATEFKKLKIALLLESEMLDWVVKIQVYEKEKEDYERGPDKD